MVASSLLCIESQDFPIPLCRDDDEIGVFSAVSKSSLDETLIDHDLTTGTDNPNDGVPNDSNRALGEVQSHPLAQLLEDEPEVSPSQQENIKKLEYSDFKRQKVNEQLGNDTATIKMINRHNCVKDRLVLFKEQGIANCNLCFVFKRRKCKWSWRDERSIFCVLGQFCVQLLWGASHFTFSVSTALSQVEFSQTSSSRQGHFNCRYWKP